MSGYNDTIIEEFRANGGVVKTSGFGSGLVLLHSSGARTGEERVNPVAAITDDSGWLIIASAAGSPRNPAWYHNLVAHPESQIEVPADGAIERVAVSARELSDDEYPAAWQRFTARSRGFEEYATRTQGRRMPIFHLARR